MSKGAKPLDSSLVSISEAVELTGLEKQAINRIIRRNQLETFENPLDRRQKLVRGKDLFAAMQPIRREP